MRLWLVKAFKDLQKLHDQWRDVGPTSVEKKEEIWEKIQELENENLNLINSRKDLISQEINGIKTHVKAISSYKFKKDQEPRLFDDSL